MNLMTIPILVFKFAFIYLYFLSDEKTDSSLLLCLAIFDIINSYLTNLLPSTSGKLDITCSLVNKCCEIFFQF